jgi:nitrogen fixation NifU-like protein
MDRQEAIDFLLDHYENPRNRGELDHPDVSLSGGNPGCADIITMNARFGKDGKLEAISWDGEGCTISRAAASYVTEIVQGMTPEEIEAMSFEDLINELGRAPRWHSVRSKKACMSIICIAEPPRSKNLIVHRMLGGGGERDRPSLQIKLGAPLVQNRQGCLQ